MRVRHGVHTQCACERNSVLTCVSVGYVEEGEL